MSMQTKPTTESIEQCSVQRRASSTSTEAELDTASNLLQVMQVKRSNIMQTSLLPVNRCIRHHLLLTWSI